MTYNNPRHSSQYSCTSFPVLRENNEDTGIVTYLDLVDLGTITNFGVDLTQVGGTNRWDNITIDSWTNLFTAIDAHLKIFDARLKQLENSAKYYWYVGTDPITSSSVPGAGTVTDDETALGWHHINGEPTEIQVGPTARLTANTAWYVAIPSYLGITKATSGGLTDEAIQSSLMTLADGIEYRVFVTPAMKKIDYLMTK